MQELIRENAERLRHLFARIHEFKRPAGPAHRAACAEFHESYDALAFPGGLDRLDRLKERDPETIAAAVQFLEAAPHFFRSGYLKEEILQRLKSCPLTDGQRERLSLLIIRSIDGGPRRVHRAYARLAGVVHPPELIEAVRSRARSDDPEVKRRAEGVLEVIQSRADPGQR